MKKKKTPSYEQQAVTRSDADNAAKNEQISKAGEQIDAAAATSSSITPELQSFYAKDATGSTPFRRALLNTKVGATSRAYDDATSRVRERAQAAGFGFEQPITMGAENAVENEKAGALARIPGEVEMEALDPEMQAMGMVQDQAGFQNTLAGQRANLAGAYDPEGYFNTANANDQAARERKSRLWSGLAGVGGQVASAAIRR